MIENFPKKCIMCKRTDANLFSYRVGISKSKSYRKRTTITKRFSVPVCEDCRTLLKRRENINLLNYCFVLITIIIFAFSSVPLILRDNYLIPTLSVGVVSLVITLILFIIKSIYPHNIKKYVQPSLDGIFYDDIIDPEYRQEVINHLKTKAIKAAIDEELGLNLINCPQCGTEQNKTTDFCLNCGKDLRTLI